MEATRPASWVVRSAVILGALALLALLATAGTPAGLAQSPSPDVAPDPGSDVLAYPLEGTSWRLIEYAGPDQARAPGPEVAAWLRLGDGRVSGFDGCARLRGRFVAGPDARGSDLAQASPAPSSTEPGPSAPATVPDDALLAFDALHSGTRSCAEQTMLVVDAIRRGLARTASFRLLPASPAWTTVLELDDAAGLPVLRFTVDDAGSLAATTWLLESVDGTPALSGSDGQPAVILFDALDGRVGREERAVRDRLAAEGRAEAFERRLTGSTGCNSYSGRYFVTGRVLSIGDLKTTTDPCPAQLLEQEAVVLDILGASSLQVTLPPGRLELRSDDDSRVLTYRAAAPLEDEQWILERQDGRRVGSDEIVTLYLAPDDLASTADMRSGTISGEGPCRPYSGSYRTDGLLVAFGDAGGDDVSCATPSAERRYLRLLRRAAFAEVGGGSLRLLDGQARELLVYSTPGLP